MSRRRKAIYFNLFALPPTLTKTYDAVGTKTRGDCMSSHFGRDFCPRGVGVIGRRLTLRRSFVRWIYVRDSTEGRMPARNRDPGLLDGTQSGSGLFKVKRVYTTRFCL